MGKPPFLANLPGEHTAFMPPSSSGMPYLVFGASRATASGTGGAVALETTDLTNFSFAASLINDGMPYADGVPTSAVQTLAATNNRVEKKTMNRSD